VQPARPQNPIGRLNRRLWDWLLLGERPGENGFVAHSAQVRVLTRQVN